MQTNQSIEFSNVNHAEGERVNPKYEKLNPLWRNKRRVEEKFIETRTDTAQRLFGNNYVNVFNVQRAQYLRHQDVRDKNYNFLG
jgi:hypothetical protein